MKINLNRVFFIIIIIKNFKKFSKNKIEIMFEILLLIGGILLFFEVIWEYKFV